MRAEFWMENLKAFFEEREREKEQVYGTILNHT
jgi:hypothetical protein